MKAAAHSMIVARRMALRCLLLAIMTCAGSIPQPGAATVPTGFTDELVESGLSRPTSIAFLPDGRLLFVEQKTSLVRMIVNNELAPIDPVMTVPDVNITGGERGLLGIAVDPEWPTRPYVYTHSTSTTIGKVRVSRFRASGDLSFTGNGAITLDPASRFDVIADIPDNHQVHQGGSVKFHSDGTLLVSVGEDFVSFAAQDTSSMRGVILRLRTSTLPDGPGASTREQITPPDNPLVATNGLNGRLIWCWGLRNPFRIQVDPVTGHVFIGDVGENTWEEVNEATGPGKNFGWPHYEGNTLFDPAAALVGPHVPAIYPVHRSQGWASVMIAGVYRAPSSASRPFALEYEGDLFVSDYFAGVLRRLEWNGSSWNIAPPVDGQPTSEDWATGMSEVSDYAIAPDGSLWYCRQTSGNFVGPGQIRRIVAPEVGMWINNAAATEGNLGTTDLNLTVRLSQPAPRDITVDFVTADGSATLADSDYLFASATLTIPMNEEAATLTLGVVGDLTPEAPETFNVTLSNASLGVLLDAVGQGTIIDDDGPPTATEDSPVTAFALGRISPNPVKVAASIEYAVPHAAHVRLTIVDLQGREVAVLVDDVKAPGRHKAVWRGGRQPGVYFSRLQAGSFVETRKFALLK